MKLSKLQLSKKSHTPPHPHPCRLCGSLGSPAEQNLCLNFLNLLISLNDCFLFGAFLTQTNDEGFQP